MILKKDSKYYEDVLLTNQELIRDQYDHINPPLNIVKAGIDNHTTFFLLKDDKVCAVANLVEKNQKEDEVLLLFIGSRFKREGYGTKLLKEIEQYAKKNNKKYILVTFAAEDFRAVHFYLKNGFELTNFRPKQHYHIYDAYKKI